MLMRLKRVSCALFLSLVLVSCAPTTAIFIGGAVAAGGVAALFLGGDHKAKLPGVVSNPTPADNASNVALNQNLSWTAATRTKYYKVYLDQTNPPSALLCGSLTATTIDPGYIDNGAVYYWRVDACNSRGTTAGPVWTFTTQSVLPAPAQVSNPAPADNAADVALNATLSWDVADYASSYDVYFDTVNPPVTLLCGSLTGTSVSPGALLNGTTYYWRVDSVNPAATTAGAVWQFATTMVYGPVISDISPTAIFIGDNITITGQYFSDNAGTVSFQGPATALNIYLWNDSTIICEVPSGASSGDVSVTNSIGASNGYAITVVDVLTITTATLPDAGLAALYSASIATNGGLAPLAWDNVGEIPPGLVLDNGIGLISGTPTLGGAFNFTIIVTDSMPTPQSVNQSYTLNVIALPLIVNISPGAALEGDNVTITGQYFSDNVGTVTFGGSVTAVVFELWNDSMIICTVPAGALTGDVTVTSSVGTSPGYAFTVLGTLDIVTTSLPDAALGIAYSEFLNATGGTPAYTWGNSGELPLGLALNTATGEISGTPTLAGVYNFYATIVDSGGPAQQDCQSLSITVIAPPVADFTADCLSGFTPLVVTFTFTGSGTVDSYLWLFGDGENSTEISPAHTYTTEGTFTVSLTVTNIAGGDTATKTGYISVDLAGRPTIVTVAPADNTTDVSIGTAITAAFSEDMNASTITSSTFFLTPNVPGTITYNAADYTATFTPAGALAFSTIYFVTVTNGVKDATDVPMRNDYIWSFSTGAPADDNTCVFVDWTNAGTENGTMAAPYNTITEGVTFAGGRIIIVASGTYAESINFTPGLYMYGGYNASSLYTQRTAFSSVINATLPVAVLITNGSSPTTIDGFEIRGGTGTDTVGVLLNSSSMVSITNCRIFGGAGTTFAAGVYCHNSPSGSIQDCYIYGYIGTSGYTYAIIECNSNVDVRSNTLFGGSSATGYNYGIGCFQYSSPLVEYNDITGGNAGLCRGVYCITGCWPTVRECTIVGCSSATGASYCVLAVDNSSLSIDDCDMTNGIRATGAPLLSYPALRRCTVTGTSTVGNAFLIDGNASMIIEDCTATGQLCMAGAAGFTVVTVDNLTMTQTRNMRAVFAANGILIFENSSVTATVNQEVIYANANANATFRNCKIQGGGTTVPIVRQVAGSAALVLENNNIFGTNYTAVQYDAGTGGIYGNVIIPGNATTASTYGISTTRSIPIINNYVYSGTTTAGIQDSVAIYLNPTAGYTAAITNNTLRCQGVATQRRTIGFYITAGARPIIANNIIYMNPAGAPAFAFREWGGTSDPDRIENNCAYGWTVLYRDDGTDITDVPTMEASVVTTGTVAASGNIDNDPLLTTETFHSYHLQAASPCVDHGRDTSGATYGTVTQDIDGEARPKGAAYDIGCDEQ
jgi:PKD repeat protein